MGILCTANKTTITCVGTGTDLTTPFTPTITKVSHDNSYNITKVDFSQLPDLTSLTEDLRKLTAMCNLILPESLTDFSAQLIQQAQPDPKSCTDSSSTIYIVQGKDTAYIKRCNQCMTFSQSSMQCFEDSTEERGPFQYLNLSPLSRITTWGGSITLNTTKQSVLAENQSYFMFGFPPNLTSFKFTLPKNTLMSTRKTVNGLVPKCPSSPENGCCPSTPCNSLGGLTAQGGGFPSTLTNFEPLVCCQTSPRKGHDLGTICKQYGSSWRLNIENFTFPSSLKTFQPADQTDLGWKQFTPTLHFNSNIVTNKYVSPITAVTFSAIKSLTTDLSNFTSLVKLYLDSSIRSFAPTLLPPNSSIVVTGGSINSTTINLASQTNIKTFAPDLSKFDKLTTINLPSSVINFSPALPLASINMVQGEKTGTITSTDINLLELKTITTFGPDASKITQLQSIELSSLITTFSAKLHPSSNRIWVHMGGQIGLFSSKEVNIATFPKITAFASDLSDYSALQNIKIPPTLNDFSPLLPQLEPTGGTKVIKVFCSNDNTKEMFYLNPSDKDKDIYTIHTYQSLSHITTFGVNLETFPKELSSVTTVDLSRLSITRFASDLTALTKLTTIILPETVTDFSPTLPSTNITISQGEASGTITPTIIELSKLLNITTFGATLSLFTLLTPNLIWPANLQTFSPTFGNSPFTELSMPATLTNFSPTITSIKFTTLTFNSNPTIGVPLNSVTTITHNTTSKIAIDLSKFKDLKPLNLNSTINNFSPILSSTSSISVTQDTFTGSISPTIINLSALKTIITFGPDLTNLSSIPTLKLPTSVAIYAPTYNGTKIIAEELVTTAPTSLVVLDLSSVSNTTTTNFNAELTSFSDLQTLSPPSSITTFNLKQFPNSKYSTNFLDFTKLKNLKNVTLPNITVDESTDESTFNPMGWPQAKDLTNSSIVVDLSKLSANSLTNPSQNMMDTMCGKTYTPDETCSYIRFILPEDSRYWGTFYQDNKTAPPYVCTKITDSEEVSNCECSADRCDITCIKTSSSSTNCLDPSKIISIDLSKATSVLSITGDLSSLTSLKTLTLPPTLPPTLTAFAPTNLPKTLTTLTFNSVPTISGTFQYITTITFNTSKTTPFTTDLTPFSGLTTLTLSKSITEFCPKDLPTSLLAKKCFNIFLDGAKALITLNLKDIPNNNLPTTSKGPIFNYDLSPTKITSLTLPANLTNFSPEGLNSSLLVKGNFLDTLKTAPLATLDLSTISVANLPLLTKDSKEHVFNYDLSTTKITLLTLPKTLTNFSPADLNPSLLAKETFLDTLKTASLTTVDLSNINVDNLPTTKESKDPVFNYDLSKTNISSLTLPKTLTNFQPTGLPENITIDCSNNTQLTTLDFSKTSNTSLPTIKGGAAITKIIVSPSTETVDLTLGDKTLLPATATKSFTLDLTQATQSPTVTVPNNADPTKNTWSYCASTTNPITTPFMLNALGWTDYYITPSTSSDAT